jgi:hypothetical protein
MFLAAFGFAGGIGDDALGFGLADAFAGVGFDSLDGGKGPFFGALFRHLCLRRLQILGSYAVPGGFCRSHKTG